MTPAKRNALIIRAKGLAIPVASCVRAQLQPGHLLNNLTREELLALIVVLADCSSPRRLRAVTQAPGDEGLPVEDRQAMLRAAHAEYTRLLRVKQPIPGKLRLLNSEYRRVNKERRAAAEDQQRGEEAA